MNNIIGISKHIEELKEQIKKAAEDEKTVLITGPTGTGKELVARAIHMLSCRNDKPFIPVDCGVIKTDMLQSELFGHEKGAFTDAKNKRKGKIAMAHCGTLFLDEIGNLQEEQQGALMRFLNDKSYSPLGSDKLENADVRLICATNRDLHQEKVNGTFRDDFYARITQDIIETESLKTRPEDVISLIRERYPNVDPKVKFLLYSYDWPGNVRELENLATKEYAYIKKQFIKETAARIGLKDILQDIPDNGPYHGFFFDMAEKEISSDVLNLLVAIDFLETDGLDCKKLISSYEICLLYSRGFTKDKIADLLKIKREKLSKFQERFGFPLPASRLNNLFPDFIRYMNKCGFFSSQNPADFTLPQRQ